MARNALVSISSVPPHSGVLVDASESARNAARELQADNDELRETNRQLIAALEEVQSLNVTLQRVNVALHTTNLELHAELDQLRARAGSLEQMPNAPRGALGHSEPARAKPKG